VQSFFGVRSSRRGQDGTREQSTSTRPPQTVAQIQSMLDWQILEAHLAPPPQTGHQAAECVPSFSSITQEAADGVPSSSDSNRESTQHSMKTSSTRHLGYELLSREFHNSHAEVGCKARELRSMVLQAGIIESDPQSELQTSYRQLMKDATELFRVVADKMYRLRTKIDLSGSVTVRSQERHQGAVSGTRTARPHRPSAVTYQARSWHLRAGDETSSHSSNDYRVSCTRPIRARSSVRGASTFQGRNLSLVARDAALQERQSDPCDPTRRQSVHLTLSSGSVQSDTLLAENDDVANLLGIQSTFSDLPGLDMEISAHSEGSLQ